MIFKKGDLILVTKIVAIVSSSHYIKVGEICKVKDVDRFTGDILVESPDNIAYVKGVHLTPLTEELA